MPKRASPAIMPMGHAPNRLRDGVRSAMGSVQTPFSPRQLFSAGEQGVWYDPSDLTTRFQDAAGTTPAMAVEQPVGLMLDKSKGSPFAVGAHRYWRYVTGVTITGHHPRASRIVLSTATASTNIQVFTADNCDDSGVIPLAGQTYAYDFGVQTDIISAAIYATWPNGTRAAYYLVEYSDDNTNWFSAFQGNMSATTCGLFTGSVFAYNGNHASQTTLTARPTTKSGPSRLFFDADPDSLTINFTSSPGNSTIAYGVSGGDPVINYPVNISGTTYALNPTNTGSNLTGLVIVNRAMTSAETAKLGAYLKRFS